jgi:GNAT superfamily N-acetyltransferase/DNA-binding MarR family transcriptional regulator
MYFYDQAGPMALGSRLRRLADILTSDAGEVFALYHVDLDARWFPVFYTLTLKGEAAITELAADIGQSHPAVSQVVRQMTKAGVVETAKAAADSRKTLVRLTDAGRATAERLAPQCRDVAAAVDELLDQVGPGFWDSLLAVEEALAVRSMADRVRRIRKRRALDAVAIVPFTSGHAGAFKALNLAWIEAHWEPEPADFAALDHPQAILDGGGYIAMAMAEEQAVGTCALIKRDAATFELAKMAVTEAVKGQGVGQRLGEVIIAEARARGAERVYLESNTILEPAINLYRKLGFVRVAGPPSPYARCNIQMELRLDGA